MRLTKIMKDNLINIVLNKTKHPYHKKDEYSKKLQQLIYEAEPVFKQFVDEYGLNYAFRVSIRMDEYSIDVFAPLEEKFKEQLNLTEYMNTFPSTDELVADKFKPFFKEFDKWLQEIKEYDELKYNLKATIESCTTDTQLREMYPDFVKYFNSAGITTKAIKNLPAKSNLPEGLVKFGLVLTTVEDVENEIKEQQNKQEGN